MTRFIPGTDDINRAGMTLPNLTAHANFFGAELKWVGEEVPLILNATDLESECVAAALRRLKRLHDNFPVPVMQQWLIALLKRSVRYFRKTGDLQVRELLFKIVAHREYASELGDLDLIHEFALALVERSDTFPDQECEALCVARHPTSDVDQDAYRLLLLSRWRAGHPARSPDLLNGHANPSGSAAPSPSM